ncbi:pyruvate dehydrogenase, putative [Eimeria mitis]|uniref:Pyruvate dehydrogenase E1 component subunit alpha n=1 Tax=Eimeria mitis TaxID=44415 RepID=U6JRJ0_9EIME|nr:pyruvate dehydrogenase, putative [Eimeria mitis]CDJ27426.1 pyruvate dehydrogenase, putative [Eimeria mitis]
MRMKFSSICLVAPALVALGACDGGLVQGASAGEIPQPPSVLQRTMDSVCLQEFSRACLQNPHFCVGAVARRDVGNTAADGEAWRCYSVEELDFSLTKRTCVDDCGELIECQGGVKDTSLEHLSATDKLEGRLQEAQEGMCKIHVRILGGGTSLASCRGSNAPPAAFMTPQGSYFSAFFPGKVDASGVRTHQHAALHIANPRTSQDPKSSVQPAALDRVSEVPSLASAVTAFQLAAHNPRVSGAQSSAAVSGGTAAQAARQVAADTSQDNSTSSIFHEDGLGGLVRGSVRGNLRNRRENVSPVVAQMLYEDMLLGRYVEDACARLYYRGKTAGFVHLYTGQEAVSSGVLKLLRKDDAVASTYRDHVHATSKGVPAREVFAELFGKQTGCSKGFGGSMHMFSKEWNLYGGFAFIGEQIPVALGVAFSQLYRRLAERQLPGEKDQVTVCFMGDGTTNMGQFYEAMNMAALMKLPVIFVVENNNWAIGMAAQRSTAVQEIHQRGPPFGVPSIEVDGMDVLAVRAAARQAIDRARRGEGPSLIEALTYRFRGHSLADPDELRCTHEKAAFAVRDPIKHFEQYMLEMGYANEETLELTRKKMREIVDEAVEFADNSPAPDPTTAGDTTFAPAYEAKGFDPLTDEELAAYAQALKLELDREARKAKGERVVPPPVENDPNPPIVID